MKCKKVLRILGCITKNIITSVIIITLGSGCASVEKKSNHTESNEKSEKSAIAVYEGVMPNELPEHINAELKTGVTLDGYLDISKQLTEYKLKSTILTRHILDPENVVENFLKTQDNLVVKEKRSFEKQDGFLENGKATEVYMVELENGGWVQCRDVYFTFYRQGEDNEQNTVRVSVGNESEEESSQDSVPRGKELGFVSIDEVEQKLQDSLSFPEVKNMFEPEVFTYTAEYLQEFVDKEYEKAKDLYEKTKDIGFNEDMEKYDIDFSEEDGDGFYYIRIKQGVQGVPIDCMGLVDETVSGTFNNLPTAVRCLYAKDGISELHINNLFDIKEEEEIEIKSFYEMLNKFCSSHGAFETTIKYIGLSYLPILKDDSQLEFKGQPVWYFIYDIESEETTLRNVTVYNAETGEIIK